jgi:prepilin-type N-terminal cleavage/methylation domain-containing protein
VKRGFTLLELIVVIVIIGILATLATTQYTKMLEKSRGSEARIMLGNVRTNEASLRLQNGSCSATNGDVGIGGGGDAPSACTTTHYFSYNLVGAAGNVFTAVATRCTTDGKVPNGAVAGTITLATNFDTGSDVWSVSTSY